METFRVPSQNFNLNQPGLNCKPEIAETSLNFFFRKYQSSYTFCTISFITSPVIISPATDGTKALLPGICLRWVYFRAVPGGQIQWARQLVAISSTGEMGGPLE